MEFPIRFPAPFLNNSPLPCIRSGPSPYISIFPAPYLNYSPSPYITTITDLPSYSTYADTSKSKAPASSSDPAPTTHSSSASNAQVPSTHSSSASIVHVPYPTKDLAPIVKSSFAITNHGHIPYSARDIASDTKPTSSNGRATYVDEDLSLSTKSHYGDTIHGHASYASRDLASSTRSSHDLASSTRSSRDLASSTRSSCDSSSSSSSGNASYATSDSGSSGNSSCASDLAMDTSQELSTEDEEYDDDDEGKLTINDSGISCSDDIEISQGPGMDVRGSRKRKSFEPCRTRPLNDSNFRGVTITMENKLVDSEWTLVMHSKFSLPPKKKRIFRPYVDSSDEEDINNNLTPTTEEKHCASCSVKKTPLWRDAEDGTPLCNACGIRYKKYKLRCGTCWHIPKKDEFRPTCQYCGSFYEYIYPRR